MLAEDRCCGGWASGLLPHPPPPKYLTHLELGPSRRRGRPGEGRSTTLLWRGHSGGALCGSCPGSPVYTLRFWEKLLASLSFSLHLEQRLPSLPQSKDEIVDVRGHPELLSHSALWRGSWPQPLSPVACPSLCHAPRCALPRLSAEGTLTWPGQVAKCRFHPALHPHTHTPTAPRLPNRTPKTWGS